MWAYNISASSYKMQANGRLLFDETRSLFFFFNIIFYTKSDLLEAEYHEKSLTLHLHCKDNATNWYNILSAM